MIKRKVPVLAVAAAVVTLVASSVSSAPSPVLAPQPAADPRVAQIKAELEKDGFKVLEVGFQPAKGKTPPIWAAVTEARFAQPSGDSVLGQAFGIWGAMMDVLSKEPAQTQLLGGQVWTKYMLLMAAGIGNINAFFNSFQAARTDPEKKAAFEAFMDTVSFSVFDMERRQFVDQKDFINKNFADG